MMKKMLSILGVLGMAASAVAGDVFFEAKGAVTDKTEGFRFGNITFTDNDRVCAKFEQIEFDDKLPGRLTTRKIRLPHKKEGSGAYFKFSFDAQYSFTSGNGGKPQRCNQGVFFYDKKGRVLPDCYDTMYPGDEPYHYERVLYAWDEVDTIELFFQKPWAMKQKNGDTCTLNVSNVKIETATWEDAARYSDATYEKLGAPLAFKPEGNWMEKLPRTLDALKTGKPWRVVMLGDSIMQDTFHSQYHALVKREFPASNVEWILSMRGGTGCWHYIMADNFYSYVANHKPDLLVIGGISNGKLHNDTNGKDVGPTGPDAMIRVAKAARENLGCEVLIVNNPLAVDYRMCDPEHLEAPLPKQGFSVEQFEHIRDRRDYEPLKRACFGAKIPWWDEFTPSYTWLFGSGLPFRYFSRDAVHSSELGKQIIGRIMLEYFKTGK